MVQMWQGAGILLAVKNMWYTGLWVTLACAAVHPLIHLSSSNIQVEVKKNEKCPLYILSLMGFLHFSLSWRTLLLVPSLFQWFCELHRNTCAQIENPSLYSLCRQIPLLYYKVSITWPARVHSRSLIDHYTAACWFFQVTFMVAQRRGVQLPSSFLLSDLVRFIIQTHRAESPQLT